MKAIQRGLLWDGESVRRRKVPLRVQRVLCALKRCAAAPARAHLTPHLCAQKSQEPLHLLDAQSDGRVFHSNVINRSAHNTALCPQLISVWGRQRLAFQRQRQGSLSLSRLRWPYSSLIGCEPDTAAHFSARAYQKSLQRGRHLVKSATKRESSSWSEIKASEQPFVTDREDKLTSVRWYAKHFWRIARACWRASSMEQLINNLQRCNQQAGI